MNYNDSDAFNALFKEPSKTSLSQKQDKKQIYNMAMATIKNTQAQKEIEIEKMKLAANNLAFEQRMAQANSSLAGALTGIYTKLSELESKGGMQGGQPPLPPLPPEVGAPYGQPPLPTEGGQGPAMPGGMPPLPQEGEMPMEGGMPPEGMPPQGM